jgi:hypothetical protein
MPPPGFRGVPETMEAVNSRYALSVRLDGPTDPHDSGFLEPEGRSVSVRLVETGECIVARPLGYPLRFVYAFLVSVFILIDAVSVILLPVGQRLFINVGLVLTELVFLGVFGLFNHYMVSRGTFFVLDKKQRTLTLPRVGRKLPSEQIRGLFEIHGWAPSLMPFIPPSAPANKEVGVSSPVKADSSDWKADSRDWIAELIVLVNGTAETWELLSVICCARTDKVGQVGELLSDFFGVERRIIKLNWRTRQQLRAGRTEEKADGGQSR